MPCFDTSTHVAWCKMKAPSGANTAPAAESPKAPDVARMVIWTPGGSIVGSHPDFAGKKHQKPRVLKGARGMPVRQTKSTRLQLHLFHLFPWAPQLGWSANLCPVQFRHFLLFAAGVPLKVWAKFATEAYFLSIEGSLEVKLPTIWNFRHRLVRYYWYMFSSTIW